MQVKLLCNLVEELAGEETGYIVEILFNKKDVNEFLIAKKMDLTINQVRNILYKLSNYGLVSFIRKKDNKKGWYIYYWTLNVEKCLALIEKSLEEKIAKFEKTLGSRETDRYYICKPCGIEVKEHEALEHGFSCDECAEIYELSDNTPHLRDTKAKITRTSRELETIKEELVELREKEAKKRARAAKKLQKEIDLKKELLKQARAAARKKVAAAKKALEKPAKKVKKTVKKVKKTAKKVKKTVKKAAMKTKKAVKKAVKNKRTKKK
jgi:transcription initiation factor TFIIE subunit alpha